MKEFSLNNYVYFKLTSEGMEIADKHLEELIKLTGMDLVMWDLIKENDENMQYMQLWQFMKLFGEHMHNGAISVIENNKLYFDEAE